MVINIKNSARTSKRPGYFYAPVTGGDLPKVESPNHRPGVFILNMKGGL